MIRGKQLDAYLRAATSTKLSFAHGRSLDELISRICNITDRMEALEKEEGKNGLEGQQRLRVSLSGVLSHSYMARQISLNKPGLNNFSDLPC